MEGLIHLLINASNETQESSRMKIKIAERARVEMVLRLLKSNVMITTLTQVMVVVQLVKLRLVMYVVEETS